VFSTSKEFKLFDEYKRYEQIGNYMYMLEWPSRIHEAVICEVLGQLVEYLVDKPCKAYYSNIGLDARNITVYVLKDGKYEKVKYETEEEPLCIPVSVFPDLVIKLDNDMLTP